MVQIKVTPEELEQVAKNFRDVKIYLEQLHKDLCNQTEYISSMWSGATSQRFYQDFNDAKPKMFTVLMAFYDVAEELEKAAEKFRTADASYDGKVSDDNIEDGGMCGPLSSEGEGFDGKKLARDITGEMTGEYDLRRVWEGEDPSTGDKLSLSDRVEAGGMMILGVTPIGKLAKLVKGVNMTADVAHATKVVKGAEPNYVLFNKTHRDSMPKPKGRGPSGGNLQSHHGLQQQWAKENLSQYGYDPKLAPTVTIETGKGLPHTIISNAQNLRRDGRLTSGNGKWSSTLQDELNNLVSDFEAAGFSKETIRETLEQQYKMLDKLKVKYERIDY